MTKRLIVGVMCLAWYVAPMYIHPLAVQVVSSHMAFILFSETFNIYRKEFEA